MGFGQGATALVSIAIGKKKLNEAMKIHIQALLITLLISIAIGLATYLLSKPVFLYFGAEGIFLNNGLKYIKVLSIGAPIFIVCFVVC